MLFLLFYLAIPVFLRLRFLSFSHMHWIGFSQDLFLTLGICLLLLISPIVAIAAGLFFQIYLLLDAWLARHMHLRMKLRYLSYAKDFRSLKLSALDMGLLSFVSTCIALIAISALCLPFLSYKFSLWYIPLFVVAGIVAFVAAPHLKAHAYKINNPLFQEILDLWKYIWKKELTTTSLPTTFCFSGPKLLNLEGAQEPPNIIFLFLESFGQKATGVKSTPNFEKLKKEGLFFSQFYSNGTLTYRALLSSLFGIPPANKAEGLKPYVNAPILGVPGILKNRGYQTSFQHNGSLCFDQQKEFLEKHFDEIYDHHNISKNPCLGWGIDDEHLMHYSASWLENQKKPAFLTLFTISNHHPWVLPDHHLAPSFGFPSNAPQERFLQTTHYSDSCLGLFIDLLRKKKLSKNTILFILADHGQPMGEHHDNFYNSRFLFEENVHIPLLILADGKIDKPQEINALSSQVDLMPTLLDLLNIQIEIPHMGESLLREQKEKTIFMQNPYSEGFTATRKGPWKWIEGSLYHLEQDPGETHDLSALHPEVAKALQSEANQLSASIDTYYHQLSQRETPPSTFEADFSECLILDHELTSKVSKSLQGIRLENCLMLSDQGIAALFQKCPFLERVHLKGVTDITDALFEKGTPKALQKLDLSSAHQVSDKGVNLLFLTSPLLSELSINGRNLSSKGIEKLGPHLSHFKLFEGPHISEEGFLKLLQNNKHLHRLVFKDCPHLTDKVLFALKDHPLEQLWIHGASCITKEGAALLEKLPLRSLVVESIKLVKEVGI